METKELPGTVSSSTPPLRPVYRPKDPALPVKCVYYYRLTAGDDQHPTVEAYRHLSTEYITRASIHSVMEHLTLEARAGRLEPLGGSVGSLRWQRKSFIAVVVDEESDMLIVDNAMTFGGGEHTFRDGEDIRLPSLGNISGFHCINHMKKNVPGDPDLGDGEVETFEVCIHTVRYPECHQHPTRPPVLSHTETGTNQGPPR